MGLWARMLRTGSLRAQCLLKTLARLKLRLPADMSGVCALLLLQVLVAQRRGQTARHRARHLCLAPPTQQQRAQRARGRLQMTTNPHLASGRQQGRAQCQ